MKIVKAIAKGIGIVLGAAVLSVIIFVAVLTATEYNPSDVEAVTPAGEAQKTLSKGDTFTIATWNLGFGALDETADFFMDGGQMVQPATKEESIANVDAFKNALSKMNADVIFLQEVDTDSKRSYHVNQVDSIADGLQGYQNAFAYNFKTLYVPYPIPTIGKVNSGIATFSQYDMSEAARVKLPCPFSYPVRLVNLKRCLLVTRIPIANSDAQLVLVNLHLEAYDDGEGKIAQTKQLKELLNKEVKAGNYVIAGGDFNQTFSNVDTSSYPLLSEDLWKPGDIDVTGFEGMTFYADNRVPTCRSLDKVLAESDRDDFQYYMLDGFIVSDNLTVKSVETKDFGFKNTDHNPVTLEVQIP